MKFDWIKGLVLVFILLNFSAATTIELVKKDCSQEFELSWDGSSTVVKVVPQFENLFGDNCDVTFYTADKAANIVFEFDDSSYIDDLKVSILINSNSAGFTWVENYTYWNFDNLASLHKKKWETNNITVTFNGAYSNLWALYFSVRATEGPISDYPFSIASGVIALSIGGTTLLTLLCVSCWCCCKRDNSRIRRRTRIIESLRKEGYSVTRNYGTISDTTRILDDAEIRDRFGQPSTYEAPNRMPSPSRMPPPSVIHPPSRVSQSGASNYDPPPPYHTVSPSPQASSIQQSANNHSTNTVEQSPGQYNASFTSNPQPSVVISRPGENQHVAGGTQSQIQGTQSQIQVTQSQIQDRRVVPEAILIEIEPNPDSEQDLMQFGTPPSAPSLPTIDLLGDDLLAQPAFGEAN